MMTNIFAISYKLFFTGNCTHEGKIPQILRVLEKNSSTTNNKLKEPHHSLQASCPHCSVHCCCLHHCSLCGGGHGGDHGHGLGLAGPCHGPCLCLSLCWGKGDEIHQQIIKKDASENHVTLLYCLSYTALSTVYVNLVPMDGRFIVSMTKQETFSYSCISFFMLTLFVHWT